MKTKFLILFFISFASIVAKSQIRKAENTDLITIWNAIINEKTYAIKLSKNIIEINIDNKYSYKYQLKGRSGKQYFILEENQMCVSIEKNTLHINYCAKKLRESVNEIVTLNFKKQEE